MARSNFFGSVSVRFLLIVLFALLVRACTYPTTWIGGDEGVYLQRVARFYMDGLIPIAEYEARAPLLIFGLSAAFSLFGMSFGVFRGFIAVITALTAGCVYVLGRRLFSERAGVIAGLLYAVVPYTVWTNAIVKSDNLFILLGLTGLTFVLRGIEKNTRGSQVVAGVFFGLAFLENWGAISFVFASALIVCVHAWHVRNFVHIARSGVLQLGGVIVGFAPVFLWVAAHDAARAINFWFQISFSQAVSGIEVHWYPNLLRYSFWRDWGLAFGERLNLEGWVIVPAVTTFLIIAVNSFRLLSLGRARGAVIGVIALVFQGVVIKQSLGLFLFYPNYHPYLFLLAGGCSVGLFVLFLYASRGASFEQWRMSILYVVLWIGATVFAYAFWGQVYLRSIIPQLVIMAAVALSVMRLREIAYVAVPLAVISYAVGFSWYMRPLSGGWGWRQSTIENVTTAIKESTKPGETVVAMNPLPVLLAERRVFLDISPYAFAKLSDVNDRHDYYPSPKEFFELLVREKPQVLIQDRRMDDYVTEPFPLIQEYVEQHYEPFAEFGDDMNRDRVTLLRYSDTTSHPNIE